MTLQREGFLHYLHFENDLLAVARWVFHRRTPCEDMNVSFIVFLMKAILWSALEKHIGFGACMMWQLFFWHLHKYLAHWFHQSSWESLEGKGGVEKQHNKVLQKWRRKKSKTKQYVFGSTQQKSAKWILVTEVRRRCISNANNLNSDDLVF